ncbi:hypothetical protein [Mucilaginibacter pedocola]|uniref:hypothetical protein n=1 Tax=Mucilaginibacter pedocola TaxID=1792845 RepID=UPI00118082C3|nr:hypothetical protein [Mucilaginibacter pedocola]
MKKLHPFFVLGTVGIVVISTLHIFMALVLSVKGVHQTFVVLYPTFGSFLMIGVGLMMKEKAGLRLGDNNPKTLVEV